MLTALKYMIWGKKNLERKQKKFHVMVSRFNPTVSN